MKRRPSLRAKLTAIPPHRLIVFLDYDGTLTPIVRDPQSAIPSDRVLRTIKTLAADPQNSVWIISGRDQTFRRPLPPEVVRPERERHVVNRVAGERCAKALLVVHGAGPLLSPNLLM